MEQRCDEDDSSCGCDFEVPSLPTFTNSEVERHVTKSKRIWTSYRAGVYDLTDFVDKHPGGRDIFAAGGGHLEPFWNALPVHKHARVYRVLESLRIGNLALEDRKEEEKHNADPFQVEGAERSKVMDVITLKPFNANAYSKDLVQSFITPVDYHFVRLHLVVPQLNWDDHTITIDGFGLDKPIVLTMDDLKTKFKKRVVNVTLQCAGNRRTEMNKIKVTHGVAYKHTAISTATWGGVFLTDVLAYFGLLAGAGTQARAGIELDSEKFKFLDFEGADQDPAGIMSFGASVPAEIGLNPASQLLLAYEMNGDLLPPDHGYPVRVIVPGMAGFKSVKFLTRISLSTVEVDSVWEQRMYRFYHPKYNWNNIDYSSAPSLLYTNVQSAILVPTDGDTVTFDLERAIEVKGYAFSGGGNGIRRVDVTVNGGLSWTEAEIVQKEDKRVAWAWVIWQVKVFVEKNATEVVLSCRAFDNNYNSQPKEIESIWNMMGVLVNSWHSVTVKVIRKWSKKKQKL